MTRIPEQPSSPPEVFHDWWAEENDYEDAREEARTALEEEFRDPDTWREYACDAVVNMGAGEFANLQRLIESKDDIAAGALIRECIASYLEDAVRDRQKYA